MAKWKGEQIQTTERPVQPKPIVTVRHAAPVTVYAEQPKDFNFVTLQDNLQKCLSVVDNEVMKNYIPTLQNCDVVLLEDKVVSKLEQIQFFRISELVYQDDEFSVHKLATIFNALSSKPCTLVLMIQSDGQTNNFYLGVRPRDSHFSSGTMRQLLEQSLLGLFPGSSTEDYFNEDMVADLKKLNIQAVSSVTCIADYKQDKEASENKGFLQGLEKFIYGMQGKAFTAVCIANNLGHEDLVETRKEYERIYTQISPFANMQYSYTLNNSSATTKSDTIGDAKTDTTGSSLGANITATQSVASQQGTHQSRTTTDTFGRSVSMGVGKSHTIGTADGVNESTSETTTTGTYAGVGKSFGVSSGVSSGFTAGGGIGIVSAGGSSGIFSSVSSGISFNAGVSRSVARGKTHGTSHTDSVSDSVSQNLTYGLNSSKSLGDTVGKSQSITDSKAVAMGTQKGINQSSSVSTNTAHTTALSEVFGKSQTVTLTVQNKSLINTLQRLEQQMARLNECESVGMWDFAAYFLGESAAEAETAANMYRSLVSGNQSGLEIAAVNTWTDERRVDAVSKYITNFVHPVFCYEFDNPSIQRRTFVDATALTSTNELAIHLGLPRKSVKGLPVIDHAVFAQEVLSDTPTEERRNVELGVVNHFGKDTQTAVKLDLESLAMHTFITGSTGSGKSNTVYQILSGLLKSNVPFLVIEPAKGEYKNVFGGRSDVSVYGTNHSLTKQLRLNPFSFPKEVHIYEHLDRLVEIFNVCWPMYAAMPAVLKDAIEQAYINAGWDLLNSKNKYDDRLFPNFIDVLQQIDAVMEKSKYSSDNKGDYKGALCTRINSLTNGINGLIFTADEIPAADLFDKNVIVDLSRIGSSETKSLIMGLLVMKLQEYRMVSCQNMNSALSHVTVLEEAHNLLKRTSTEQTSEHANLLGKSVEMLTNAIAEMRTYGEGFIVADQAPGLLDAAVIRNTNTKIIMRLPEYSDRELVGRAIGLTQKQIVELSKLSRGRAAVYQNDWVESVLCSIGKYDNDNAGFKFEAETRPTRRDIKGKIISRLVAKDIMHLIDKIDNNLIVANMPASAKCKLFDYLSASQSQKLYFAAGVAYELFACKAAFSALSKTRLSFEQQRRFLIDNLTPSISRLPEQCSQKILCLITYWEAHQKRDAATRNLLNYLIQSERKGAI